MSKRLSTRTRNRIKNLERKIQSLEGVLRHACEMSQMERRIGNYITMNTGIRSPSEDEARKKSGLKSYEAVE